MSIYSDLSKLGRVKLPGIETPYALVDVDGRLIIAANFSSESTYSKDDYVIYQDNLYRAEVDISTAGSWDSAKWQNVTVGSELKDIRKSIVGGIHFVGATTTQLYDKATTNPITINSSSYEAVTGDLTFVDLAGVASAYAVSTAYAIHTYIKNNNIYYITNTAITASENTSFNAIADKLDALNSDPFFIFDGTVWRKMESAEGFGDLAFKDSASGTYIKPSGSGSVTVPTVTSNTSKLTTTQITGVGGTVSVSKMTAGTAKNVASAGTAVRYGTADVGSAVTYGTANRAENATRYGTANVDTAVSVVTGVTGTFNTDAIKSASLTGTQTFNTDAIKSATLTGTKTFNTNAIKVSVSSGSDCLTFESADTGTVGISTTAASTGTVGISTSAASTASVSVDTDSITPAVESPSSQTIYGAVNSSTTLTPAVAAPNTQTIVPAVANGTITPWTETAQTVATSAAEATTVATGEVNANSSGAQIVTSVNTGTTSATVTVGTTTDTVTVK